MTLLDTTNLEKEQAAIGPLFNAGSPVEVQEVHNPVALALEGAKTEISPLTLAMIDKCEVLAAQSNASEEEAEHDRKTELYDAQTAVRRCAERMANSLETTLPKGIYKLGETHYLLMHDPHTRAGNPNWLIVLTNDANVSFREPRGLMGDDEFKPATHQDRVQLIEDVIAASQSTH